MPQTVSEFREKFQVDAMTLFANDGWTVSLRPKAATLGACVISANRPHPTLAEISAEEALQFTEAVAWFERAAREAFRADKFNYLALMMVDDQLHFHALPRYAAERSAGGVSWTDPGWPGQPDLGHDPGAGGEAMAAVRGAMLAGARS